MPQQPQLPALHQEIKQLGYELQHKQDAYLKKVDLHHHDFFEIYFLMSGDVTYTIESKLYRVMPGDILLISPRELHKLHIRTDREPYERYVLWVAPKTLRRLSTGKTDLLQCLDPSRPGYRNQLHPLPEEQQYLHGLIRRLHLERQAEGYGSDLAAESLLPQILIEINRVAQRQEATEEDASRSSQVVSAAVDYIGEHYGEPLSLEELAERFYVSKYHLSHEFNRLVGTSIHRYILKKRLQIARQLMARGKRPGEVWESCGFGDYTGFYRAFRAEYGVSPKAYAGSVQQGKAD